MPYEPINVQSGNVQTAFVYLLVSAITWIASVWNRSCTGGTPQSFVRNSKMQLPKQAVLLRIFTGENDKFDGRPLYEAIVIKARGMHLAGATVLRGPMGFGKSSLVHTDKILRLSLDLPLVIEIVDSEEKINEFLPVLDGMMDSGLVTLEKLQVLQYGSDKTADA
jgi:PII-like signaling protein